MMATLQNLLKDAPAGKCLRRADGKDWPEKKVVRINADGYPMHYHKMDNGVLLSKEDLLANDWYEIKIKPINELEDGDRVVVMETIYLFFGGRFFRCDNPQDLVGPLPVITSEGYQG